MLTLQVQPIDWPAWIQAGASVFAAIGLIWTLLLQKRSTDAQLVATNDQLKISKSQLEVAERDQRRFLYEIMPEIKLNYVYNEESQTGTITYSSTKNNAYRLCIENRSSNVVEITSGLYLPTDISCNEVKKIEFRVPETMLLKNWPHNHAPFIFIVYYRDAIDTKYYSIFIKFFNSEPFTGGPPQILSEQAEYEKLIIEDSNNRFIRRKINDPLTLK